MEEPDVPSGIDFFLLAYRDLVTCRSVDGPIPWDKVSLYADKHGLAPDVEGVLWDVIRRMDAAERKWVSDNVTGG